MKKTIKILVLMLLSLGIAHNADAQWGKLLNEAGKAMNKSNNGNKTSTTSDPNRKKSSYELQEEKMNQRYEQQRLADEEKKRKEEAERQAKEEQKKAEEAEIAQWRAWRASGISEQNFYEYNHRIARSVTAESNYVELARAYMYYERCFEFGRKDEDNMAPLDIYILEMDHARDVFTWIQAIDMEKYESIKDTVKNLPIKEGWPKKWSDYNVMDDLKTLFETGQAKPFDYWNMVVKLAIQGEGIPPFYGNIDGYITGTLNMMDECETNEAKMYYMQDLLKNREHEIVMMGQVHPTEENMHTAKIQEYLDKFPKDFLAKYDLPALRNAEQLHKARYEQMLKETQPMPKIPAGRDLEHEKEAKEQLLAERPGLNIKCCYIPSDATAKWGIVEKTLQMVLPLKVKDYRVKYGYLVIEDPEKPGRYLMASLPCTQKYLQLDPDIMGSVYLDVNFHANDMMYSHGVWQYVNYK